MKTYEENKKNQRREVDRFDWFIERITFRLVKRRLRWKNFMPENLLEIYRYFVILQHDWPIKQCLLHIRVFFGGKTKSPCFDLFIHWLMKQNNEHLPEPFSRSYESLSNFILHEKCKCRLLILLTSWMCQSTVVDAPYIFLIELRACLHGGGGPQVGEVTLLDGVTRLSIWSLNLIWSRLDDWWGDPRRRVARSARSCKPLRRR